MTAWAMLAGGLLLHAGSVAASEGARQVELSAVGLLAIAYLGVVASALAYVIYFTLLDRYGPLEINLVSYLVPVVATAGGVVLFAEAVTPAMVGGFLLITTGFVVLKARVVAAELAGLGG